jgi:hypothetical protein
MRQQRLKGLRCAIRCQPLCRHCTCCILAGLSSPSSRDLARIVHPQSVYVSNHWHSVVDRRAQAPVAERPVALPPAKQGERAVYLITLRESPFGEWPCRRWPLLLQWSRLERAWQRFDWTTCHLNLGRPGCARSATLALQRRFGINSSSYLAVILGFRTSLSHLADAS